MLVLGPKVKEIIKTVGFLKKQRFFIVGHERFGLGRIYIAVTINTIKRDTKPLFWRHMGTPTNT